MTTALQSLLINPAHAGAAGGVGTRAASAALAAGYSPSQIREALQSDVVSSHNTAATGGAGAHANIQGGVNQTVMAALNATGPTSSWGTHGPTTTTNEAGETTQDWSGVSGARDQYVGAADVNFMRHQGMTDAQIQAYMQTGGRTNPNHPRGSGTQYSQMVENINLGAGLETATSNISTLQSDYDTLQSNYEALQGNYTTLQADVAQAAQDAMKIKYTGSTAVRNPSAMGIQAAQGTPFRGSGLAGTAALARPNRGMKIKTLNV